MSFKAGKFYVNRTNFTECIEVKSVCGGPDHWTWLIIRKWFTNPITCATLIAQSDFDTVYWHPSFEQWKEVDLEDLVGHGAYYGRA